MLHISCCLSVLVQFYTTLHSCSAMYCITQARADWARPPDYLAPARRAGWSGIRWDVPSNVEVGQTTYPVNRGSVGSEGQSRKEKKGGSGMWEGPIWALSSRVGRNICVAPRRPQVSSYAAADGAGLPT